MRLPALLTAALLTVGLLAAPVGPASSAPTTDAVMGSASTVAWHTCSDPQLAYYGLQCGSLAVPLDRSDPTGTQVTLALTRKVHTGSTYRGIMLANPGGPGGSGLYLPVLSDYVPGGVGATYDWIGFDPRGVGASTPSLHCDSHYLAPDRPNYVPRTHALLRYWLVKDHRYSLACASTPAKRALLQHVRTIDTVQDMDAIRSALGAPVLNFYGFSYGTYLGQVYATTYPANVGRFVLDGVVNPTRVWYAANLDQDVHFNTNIDIYFRWLAAHPRVFHLGSHWRKIRRGYYRELKRLDRHPSAQGRLGPDELTDVMIDAGYYVYDWDSLGKQYSLLIRKHRGGPLYSNFASQLGDDNGYAMYAAVQCTDVRWPGLTKTLADNKRVDKIAPFETWGNAWFNGPCLTWRAPAAAHARTVSGAALASKVLLVNETQDAATPYTGALKVRSLFPTASLIAGRHGTTHAGSLSGVSCVDDAIARYLATGVTPTRRSGNQADLNCPRVPPPTASVAHGRARSISPDRMPAVVRRELQAAQLPLG